MEDYRNAYTEVYYAINNFDDELKSKIPEEFLTYVRDRMNSRYAPVDSEMSEEAKAILSAVYSEYLCSDEEKKKWDELDNLFKKSENTQKSKAFETKKENVVSESKEITIVNKQSKLFNFFEKIKTFFKALWRK